METKYKICNMNCCVYGCHSKKGRTRDISFHLFPKPNVNKVIITNKFNVNEEIDQRKAWQLAIRTGKPITKFMRVCSQHFTTNDFIVSGVKRKFPRLKRTAVPSKNLPSPSFSTNLSRPARSERRKRQNNVPENPESNNYKTSEFEENSCVMAGDELEESRQGYNSLTSEEQTALHGLLELCEIKENNFSICTKVDKCTEVKSGDLITSFIAIIDSNRELNSLTGLHSFELLESLLLLLNKYYPPLKKSGLSMKEKVILTFMKLKTGVTYAVLACLFRVTSKSCKVIISNMISKLAVILKPVIFWPDRENIEKNTAKCYDAFSNTRIILDCTEISVQQPKCLCCRVITYSNYYGTNTIKFMTGISVSGLIAFISKGYGGRASDKTIFEQSNLIEKLEKGRDAIMVDKGFLIEDITSKNYIKLIRPPFLRDKAQFSKEEARLNADIAKARVHIERSNQRIKIFEILKKKLPWPLVSKVDDIFLVICAIVNLSSPILADDKF